MTRAAWLALLASAIVSQSLPAQMLGAHPVDGMIVEQPSAKQGPELGQGEKGIRWHSVLKEAGLLFAATEFGRLTAQDFTREALKGPYFKDYIRSLKGFHGWDDGDPWLTNYVVHPMGGSTYMWIVNQNNPKGARQDFDPGSRAYWNSRLKGVGFAAAYSTFYELGPIGDAAIGNVGMKPGTKGAVDLVITPTAGMGWNVTEDMIDKYFIRWVETKTGNVALNLIVRTWFNPTRSVANMLRFRTPWRRDTRGNLTQLRTEHESRRLGTERP